MDKQSGLFADNEDQRRIAIIEASQSADRTCLERLLELSATDTYANRRHVVRALGRIGGAEAESRLLELLQVEDGRILGDLAQALRRLKSASAAESIRRLESHHLEWVRQNARWAVEQMGAEARPMPTIRPEQPADIPAIHAVHASSFPTDAEARLVDTLRASNHLTVSLVAEVEGVVVGHIAFSPVSNALGQVGMGLAPIAVLETHRRRGIAAELVRAGLETCRAAGVGWAVVLGEPAYYSRFGFCPASEFGLIDEYGGGAAFQAIELTAGGLPKGAGLVKYGPEFATFG